MAYPAGVMLFVSRPSWVTGFMGLKTDLRAGYLKCNEKYRKFEYSINYSFREVVQMIKRQLLG